MPEHPRLVGRSPVSTMGALVESSCENPGAILVPNPQGLAAPTDRVPGISQGRPKPLPVTYTPNGSIRLAKWVGLTEADGAWVHETPSEGAPCAAGDPLRVGFRPLRGRPHRRANEPTDGPRMTPTLMRHDLPGCEWRASGDAGFRTAAGSGDVAARADVSDAWIRPAPGSPSQGPALEWWPRLSRHRPRPSRVLRSVGIATACVAATTATKLGIDAWLGEGTPWIVSLAGVLIAAWRGGAGSGIVATALAALVCDALFLDPEGLLSIPSPNDRFRLILFLAEGILVSGIMGSLHGARRAAERSRAELAQAYEASIEGWARILDMRDRETEGHSRRVAEMTVRVARALGFGADDLVHVRRGALLHDIGKIGIPDRVLLKEGPLDDHERAMMRMHPSYAVDVLGAIGFLRPALEIPLCHHERWDGAGYPRGLKGSEIPLAARIFAVVDVWDALTHDRPYRSAWPEEKVRAYLLDLAGTHLDPSIVPVFLDLVSPGDGTQDGPPHV